MRVIVFVKATEDSEKGIMPTTGMFEEMGRFNKELIQAGIFLCARRPRALFAGQANRVRTGSAVR